MSMRLALAILSTITLWGQVQPPPAPWRGAGPTPCVGSDGGILQCPSPARVIAVRAGRMFNSKTGQMLTKQVVILNGDRITDVGPEAQIKIPAGAQVIDLMEALRASLEKTAGKRAPLKSVAAAPASEIKGTSRKPPKKIAPEPETRRKTAKR